MAIKRLERRQSESGRIRAKYPDRIPVIAQKAAKTDLADIDKNKYLVPADLTVGQFVDAIRKRIKASSEKAVFVFVKDVLPPTAALMSSIYAEHKDKDGFLYMAYSGENTFGVDVEAEQDQPLLALRHITSLVTKGASDMHLQEAVRKTVALRDQLSDDLLRKFKSLGLSVNGDLLCFLEFLNDEKAKKQAIRRVKKWNCDPVSLNPLQLALYDLVCEAILKTDVQFLLDDVKGSRLSELKERSGEVVLFVETNDVLLLHGDAMINVINSYIREPAHTIALLGDIKLLEDKDQERVIVEMRTGISTTRALEVLRESYEHLPPPAALGDSYEQSPPLVLPPAVPRDSYEQLPAEQEAEQAAEQEEGAPPVLVLPPALLPPPLPVLPPVLPPPVLPPVHSRTE